MKLTPLLLFLLLLVILVIAVITLKNPLRLPETEKEGFIQFQANVVPQMEVKIPAYSSNSVVKLYDNLFFDRKNANVIEVCSDEFKGNIDAAYVVTGGNVDLTGQSIKAINVQTRDGAIKNYPVSDVTVQDTQESKITTITGAYKVNPLYTTVCKTTGSYQMFYIPWNTDTYIHGIQLTDSPSSPTLSAFKPANIFTYHIPSDSTKNMNATFYKNNLVTITKSSATSTTGNNTLVYEPLYSSSIQVYQLSLDVKYNIKNGDLIVNSDSGYITVYDRSGKSNTYKSAPTTISSSITTVPYAPWIINNSTNTIQVVYIQSEKNTLVALFRSDDIGRYVLMNQGRFNETSVDNGSSIVAVPGATDVTGGPPVPDANMDKSAVSDYFKWYWYWNSAGPGTNPKYSNEYMLKTQIVPPVCPSCPSVSCGTTGSSAGNGVSKTADSAGNVVAKTVDSAGNAVSNTVDSAGNVVTKTVDTAGNVVTKTVDTASNLLTSGATGASNLLTSGATGASNLVTSGVTGATNLATSGVTGATNLLTSGVSGAANLLRDAGSGAVGIVGKTLDTTGNVLGGLTHGQGQGGAGAYYGGLNTPAGGGYRAPGFSQGNPPTDSYSYYGALPNKGANYIPITADFSAFKK